MRVFRTVASGRVSDRCAHDGGLVSSTIMRRDGGGAVKLFSQFVGHSGKRSLVPVETGTVLFVASMMSIFGTMASCGYHISGRLQASGRLLDYIVVIEFLVLRPR